MDCVFLVFLTIGAIKGVKKGVFEDFLRLVIFVVAGIVAVYVSNKIVETWLCESKVFAWLENQISSFMKNICENIETKEDFLIFMQSKNNIVALIITKLIDCLNITPEENFVEMISQKAAILIEKMLVFVIVFLVVYIILRKITKFARKISGLASGGVIDKIFGIFFGVGKAAVLFGLLYFAVGILSNMVQNQFLTNLMQNDKVVSVIYNLVYEKTISVFLPY